MCLNCVQTFPSVHPPDTSEIAIVGEDASFQDFSWPTSRALVQGSCLSIRLGEQGGWVRGFSNDLCDLWSLVLMSSRYVQTRWSADGLWLILGPEDHES